MRHFRSALACRVKKCLQLELRCTFFDREKPARKSGRGRGEKAALIRRGDLAVRQEEKAGRRKFRDERAGPHRTQLSSPGATASWGIRDFGRRNPCNIPAVYQRRAPVSHSTLLSRRERETVSRARIVPACRQRVPTIVAAAAQRALSIAVLIEPAARDPPRETDRERE